MQPDAAGQCLDDQHAIPGFKLPDYKRPIQMAAARHRLPVYERGHMLAHRALVVKDMVRQLGGRCSWRRRPGANSTATISNTAARRRTTGLKSFGKLSGASLAPSSC
ncbi:hypothetical protein Bpro_2635 [Polaromonas sp. JS666]|nr:hypothetical protein Bpro_2635 [Polaromonas sp. JS666]